LGSKRGGSGKIDLENMNELLTQGGNKEREGKEARMENEASFPESRKGLEKKVRTPGKN